MTGLRGRRGLVLAMPVPLGDGMQPPKEGSVNKSEMADKLAGKADVSKTKAAEIIDTIFSTNDGEGIIAAELDAGRKVSIFGFGTFSTKHRSARKGRNPATGETIDIPAKEYPHFSASKGLKDRVER